jgi:ATP-dependent helicase/nuclease subunit A
MLEKPAGATWTDEQWEAIAARGSNILVAAAAGSGKTAVLVERIIRRICEKDSPLDVDRLLVVTFTKAAASEMRQRIGEAIEKALAAEPSSLHLRRQLTLLNKASIMTLHSFCMEVLKRFYYLIDLDPGFRIADEAEAELMRQDVMEQLFEEEYGLADSAFFRLVDSYSGDRSDVALQALIQRLYHFSRSHPQPETWLAEMAAMYNVRDLDSFYRLPWFDAIQEDVRLELRGLDTMLTRAEAIAQSEGGPLPYLETIKLDEQLVNTLLTASERSWGELYEAFVGTAFSTLKRCSGKDIDTAKKDQAKAIRDEVKKRVLAIKDELFRMAPEDYLKNVQENAPFMEKIIQLVLSFEERYRQAKKEKGLVDFSDLEHFTLQILRDFNGDADQLRPSAAALDYRLQFEEVLVDEYQDTNAVQEAIVRLVSRHDDGQNGNLFMVGDVKQSIYRFRLAEPELFLDKYKRFTPGGGEHGWRIDLARNFRSRPEVIDATNFIFRQIMNETVSEIAYDKAAELVLGAADYPQTEDMDMSVDVMLIDRFIEKDEAEDGSEDSGVEPINSEIENDPQAAYLEASELENVQLEARLIARKIKLMIAGNEDGQGKQLVYDKKNKVMRPVQYRDMVILMRATSGWAEAMAEEFKLQGIPSYAEVSTGYFSATEVEVMTSLLQVIDNPYQDIPLTGVLRSPILRLNAEQLAQVRLANRDGSFYEAVLAFIGDKDKETAAAEIVDEEIVPVKTKLAAFVEQLNRWRTEARQGSLSSLIWQIYRETGYYDFIGGLPGGRQRQANLQALYERSLQYESTSFRGLFRFLRFIERMRGQGSDLGAARSLSEQEDVVRIMTIHKSKGLEFPVVFVAGLGKQFNLMDVRGSFLLHKLLGFGPRHVDPELRVTFPTLPNIAMKRRMKAEQLAEEMRVLYVALTRAREKLILVGTLRNLEKAAARWANTVAWPDWTLPDFELARGKTFLDWLGPALIRHKSATSLLQYTAEPEQSMAEVYNDSSVFRIFTHRADDFVEPIPEDSLNRGKIEQALEQGFSIPVESPLSQKVAAQLTWKYAYSESTHQMAKQSVSEIKRRSQKIAADEQRNVNAMGIFRRESAERPLFLSEKRVTAAERGTAIHTVMQSIPFTHAPGAEELEDIIAQMVVNEQLTEAEAASIDREGILAFFASPAADKIYRASRVFREMAFNLAVDADKFDAGTGLIPGTKTAGERIIIQGVIDCLLDYGDGCILLDYKSDDTEGISDEQLARRYKTQLDWYAEAVEQIVKKPVLEKVLYFFNGGRTIHV